MKRIWVCLLLLAFSNTSCAAVQYGLPGQLTLQVIEENGKPVENAEVIGYFGASYHGTTDSQGMYTIKGTSMDLHFAVTKTNYYKTNGIYDFSIHGSSAESRKQGRWLPWNPTYKVVLRRKINPVGMYWKGEDHAACPLQGQPVGYDLIKGDWVAPYGTGEKSDFIFNCQSEGINYQNWHGYVTITFSNKEDGIQLVEKPKRDTGYYREYLGESEFTIPHIAPETGYQNTWVYKYGRKDGQMIETIGVDPEYSQYLFFRVRTEVDKDGKIISALYGKVHGGFLPSTQKNNSVTFTYYLNPDGTRNMEHDPGKLIDLKGGR